MDLLALRTLYDREQRIEIEYPDARVEAVPPVVRLLRPAPAKNFVLYSQLTADNAEAIIQRELDYFAPLGQDWEWKVCDYDQPLDLKERLAAHGFVAEEPEAVMVFDLQTTPPVLLQPVTADVRPITQRAELQAVITVLEKVWGGNFTWVTQRLGRHLETPDFLNIYVAYVDDQPACVAWIYFHPHSQFASLWGGSTLAAYRQRGLYTALLATRAQEALRRGYRYLTIDAGPMSRPIVAKHGFEVLTYAVAYDLNQAPKTE